VRPYPEEVLKAIQAGIAAHFLPELQSAYARAQFGFGMLLFGIAQRDYDTAVPDLIEHNRALRALLAVAGAALASLQGDAAAAARATLASLPGATSSLRLSDLRAESEALRGAVAALAPLVEPAADDPALAPLRDTRVALFAYLKSDAEHRKVPILTA